MESSDASLHNYRILHELSFDINFCETSLRHVIKHAFGELCNVSITSIIAVYIKMTICLRFILSHDI